MKILFNLVKRELILLKYNFAELILGILSVLLTVFIFLLIYDTASLNNITILYGLILITTVLTIGFSDYFCLLEEFRSGVLEQMFLLPVSTYQIIIVKYVISFTKYIIIHSVFWMILCEIIGNISFSQMFFSYVLFVCYLLSVSLLITSIALAVKKFKQTLASILMILIIFPQILLSIASLENSIYLLLMLCLYCLIIPIFLIFSTLIIQNAISDDC